MIRPVCFVITNCNAFQWYKTYGLLFQLLIILHLIENAQTALVQQAILCQNKDRDKKYYTILEIQKKWYPPDYNVFIDKEFKVNDVVYIKDKITGKVLYNSTYGFVTGLCFNNYMDTPILFFENKYDDFKIGDKFKKTLHFNFWYYNGIKYLWIDELILWYFVKLNLDIKRISNIKGTLFEPNCKLINNEYFINLVKIAGSFNCSLMNISFEQGYELFYGDTYSSKKIYIDKMDSLKQGLSKNEYINFADINNDDNLSLGDYFKFEKLTSTKDKRSIDSYIFSIKGMVSGDHFFINWYKGIFDFTLLSKKSEYSLETYIPKQIEPDIDIPHICPFLTLQHF